MDVNQKRNAILQVVAYIPKGVVATYGQIAELAGLVGRARLVGKILAETACDVPWHRVIRADGTIAQRLYGREEQAVLLRQEGVIVSNFKIDLRIYQLQSKHDS